MLHGEFKENNAIIDKNLIRFMKNLMLLITNLIKNLIRYYEKFDAIDNKFASAINKKSDDH